MARRHEHTSHPPRPVDPAIEVIAGIIDLFQANQGKSVEELAPQIEACIRKYPQPERDLAKLPAEQSDDLVAEALEIGGPRGAPRAVAALRLEPWNHLAWQTLADAFTSDTALPPFFQNIAVFAARRAISPAKAEELAGRYCDDPAGEDLIEAMALYSSHLRNAGRWWDAFHTLDEAFQLDAQDRQFIRYLLLPATLVVHELDYAEHLVEDWTMDDPAWPYLHAMTEYARWGATPQGRDLLLKAFQAYPGVARYLLSPGLAPKDDATADEVDAHIAAEHIREPFKRYGGALSWLQQVTGERPGFAPLRRAATKVKRHRHKGGR